MMTLSTEQRVVGRIEEIVISAKTWLSDGSLIMLQSTPSPVSNIRHHRAFPRSFGARLPSDSMVTITDNHTHPPSICGLHRRRRIVFEAHTCTCSAGTPALLSPWSLTGNCRANWCSFRADSSSAACAIYRPSAGHQSPSPEFFSCPLQRLRSLAEVISCGPRACICDKSMDPAAGGGGYASELAYRVRRKNSAHRGNRQPTKPYTV